MAERRMFAKTIIDSDAFIDMPLSTQALYFHLAMRADDDGFINNPKKIQRMVGASDDDLKLLAMKRYILPFESGVVVIKHWRIHNYIQRDRYKPTVYTEEKSSLTVKENGAYTECIQDVYNMEAQDRLELEIGKNSIEKENKRDKSKTFSDIPELNEAIVGFIDYRRQIKQSMSTRAINLLVSKLNSLSSDPNEQIEILNQSIINGWKGVFPLKGGATNGSNKQAPLNEEYGTVL